jgi:hypothetical protein
LAGETHDVLSVSRYAFLGGTLEVKLAALFTPSLNQMFTILTADAGVEGEFETLSLPTNYQWDVIYNENDVTLKVIGLGGSSQPGDFNNSGSVNGADLTAWKAGFPSGTYDGNDFLVWQRNLTPGGTSAPVPEPGSWALAALAAMGISAARRRPGRP